MLLYCFLSLSWKVSSHMLSVHEGDPRPAVLTLKSTIPITCNRLEDGVLDDSCNLTLKLTTSADILLRNRNGSECMITLTEEDWRSEEKIEIFAKVDSFMTGPRWNILTIGIATLPNKIAADGLSYTNMWSRHRLPEIGVGSIILSVQSNLRKTANAYKTLLIVSSI